jgi:lipopolysaccharide/colanic/teichoic acid biosynthesis glycosyltransferase
MERKGFFSKMRRQTLYASGLKRVFDASFSGLALVLFSPLLLLLYALSWRNFGAPVFFRQMRPGLNGKPFRLIKFRTMTNAQDVKGQDLPDDLRLTPYGKFLRASSLDELPELWNILRGDMSFVGPRPLLMEYLPRYTPEQARRHDLRPGLTGWAQVNGRNALTWPEKFAFDCWYIDNFSFWLDMAIIFRTVGKIIKRDGIMHDDQKGMPKFMGTDASLDEKQ